MNKHQEALKANIRLGRLKKALGRRTAALTVSKRLMKQGVIHRKMAEQEHRKNGKHSAELLRESHQLQEHLRYLIRQILLAHEAERKSMSEELHHEVAQTLLAINVLLASLKKAARGNTAKLEKEIANTQRLVRESLRSVNWFVRELGIHQRAGSRPARPNGPRRSGAGLPASADGVKGGVRTKTRPGHHRKT